MSAKVLVDDVIPLMIKHNIIQEVHNKNTQQRSTRAWALKELDISDIYRAEEEPKSPLFKFWVEVNNHD